MSVVSLIQATLRRIAELDHIVNAIVSKPAVQSLLDAASLSDAKLGDQNLGCGKLEGVPIAIKDNIAVAGMPLTCASMMLRGITSSEYTHTVHYLDYIPPKDAECVRLLRQSGAIVLGKTNLDEFGMGSSTTRSIFGVTRNPLDLSRSAGGSSGGSAAAVAAGYCRVAIGSDTGGSIRLPASYCGLVGFKPSYGRISRAGLVSYACSLDTVGILGASVDEVAKVFECINAEGKEDMTHWKLHSQYPADNPRKMVVGIPEEFFPHELSSITADTVERYLNDLGKLGTKIKRVSLPTMRHALSAYYVLASVEASSCLSRFTGTFFGGSMKAGAEMDSNDNASTIERWSQERGIHFGEEVKRRIFLGTAVSASNSHNTLYQQACRIRQMIKSDFSRIFEAEGIDLLISPTTAGPAPLLDEGLASIDSWLADAMTVPASLAGIPAISIPSRMASTSLPIGIQIMAPFGYDQRLLDFANFTMP